MKIKYKRLFAYIIDIMLVGVVIGLICDSNLMTKQMDKYNDSNNNLQKKLVDILSVEEDDSQKDISSIESEIKAAIYDTNKFGIVYNLINITATVGYFAVFQFFNKGQTIGKKLLRIKTVSKDGKELNLINYILRTIILYGIIFTVANMIGTEIFKVKGYYSFYTVTSALNSIINLILLFMILFRKDERGLHDIISCSKVIEE